MTDLVDRAAAEAAALLHSLTEDRPVLRRSELVALGITDTTQAAMVRRGLLTRVRHGVYASAALIAGADAAERHRIDAAAAVAASRQPCWALGSTAALFQSLPLPFTAPSTVRLLRRERQDLRSLTQASRHPLEIPDVEVRASSHITDADVEIVRGVASLTRVHAALTAAREVSSWRKVVLFDALLWQGTDPDDIAAAEQRWGFLGQGAEVARALTLARPGAQTPLETLSRLSLMREGLPEPRLQESFHDAAGLIGVVDMWWPDLGVIGEADGLLKYGTAEAFPAEKWREDRLRALGLMVVRWGWEEINAHPELVAERIRRAARVSLRPARGA